MCWPDLPICQQYDWKTYALRVTENWRKSENFPPTISILFFFFEKEIFFWFFLSLLKKSSLSLFCEWWLWIIDYFKKQTNKKPSDHMKKNVNKQLIIWKKNSRKTRDLHIFREDWKRSHIYNTILWQRTKKI